MTIYDFSNVPAFNETLSLFVPVMAVILPVFAVLVLFKKV